MKSKHVRFKKTALALCLMALNFSVCAADINEKPVPGKNYGTDFVIFDNSGQQSASLQDKEVGVTKDYYLTGGALIDGTNGDDPAIFIKGQKDANLTVSRFYIGEGNFTVKQMSLIHI